MTVPPDTPLRLSVKTLHEARTPCVPAYDRRPEATIAHLGFGAFARAHLAVFADDLCRQGRPSLVRGVSLHSHRVADRLARQDFLYTVAEREPQTGVSLRVVGSVSSVTSGPAAALHAVSAPTTKLVTLTITEKGYDLHEGDLAHPHQPDSVLGVLALALARCREAGSDPPIIASLDNVMENGSVLRSRVGEIASHLDPTLPAWLADEVKFPNSVVDRMVPAPTERDMGDIGARLGLADLAGVSTEQHRSWVMSAADGMPALGEAGVQLVTDTGPFERRKLWLLNGPHSALAYCGILAGCTTIAEATEHGTVSTFVRKLVDDILRVARLPVAVQAESFALDALRRFQNPNLDHTCAKVAADGSRKLPQRFGSIVSARSEAGHDTDRFAVVVALWIALASKLEIQGSVLPSVEDPAGPRLHGATRDLGELARLFLEDRFDEHFVTGVTRALVRLPAEGMRLVEELA
jgi:fructuronate reductase